MPLRNDATINSAGNVSPMRRSVTDRESLGSHSSDTSINELRQQMNLFDSYSSYYESDEDDSELITFHDSNADTMNDSLTTLDTSINQRINQSTEGSLVGNESNTTSITQVLNGIPAPASVSIEVFRNNHDDHQSTSSNDDDDFKRNICMPLHYENSSGTNTPLQVSNLIPTRYERPLTSIQSCNETLLLGCRSLSASEHSSQEPLPEYTTLSTSYSTNALSQDTKFHNCMRNSDAEIVQPILSTSHTKVSPSLNEVHFANQTIPSVEYSQEFCSESKVNFDEEGQQSTLVVNKIGDHIQSDLYTNSNSTSDYDEDKDEYIVFDYSCKFDRRVLSSQSDFSTKTTLQPDTDNTSQTIINQEHDPPTASITECMAVQANANTITTAAWYSNIVVAYATYCRNPICRKVSKSGVSVTTGRCKVFTIIFFIVLTIAAITSVSVGTPLLRGTVKSSYHNVTSATIQNKTDSNLVDSQKTVLDSDTTIVSDTMTDEMTHDTRPNIVSTLNSTQHKNQQNQDQQTKQTTNAPTKLVTVHSPVTKPNESVPESLRPRSVKPTKKPRSVEATNKPITVVTQSLITDYTQSEPRRNQPTFSAPVSVPTTKTQSPTRVFRTSQTIKPVIQPTPSPKTKKYATVRPQNLQMQIVPTKSISASPKQKRWTTSPVQRESNIVNVSKQKPSSPSPKPSKKPIQKQSKRPTPTQSIMSLTQQHLTNQKEQQQNSKNQPKKVENQQKIQIQEKQKNPGEQQQIVHAKKQQQQSVQYTSQLQQPMYAKLSQQHTSVNNVPNISSSYKAKAKKLSNRS